MLCLHLIKKKFELRHRILWSIQYFFLSVHNRNLYRKHIYLMQCTEA